MPRGTAWLSTRGHGNDRAMRVQPRVGCHGCARRYWKAGQVHRLDHQVTPAGCAVTLSAVLSPPRVKCCKMCLSMALLLHDPHELRKACGSLAQVAVACHHVSKSPAHGTQPNHCVMTPCACRPAPTPWVHAPRCRAGLALTQITGPCSCACLPVPGGVRVPRLARRVASYGTRGRWQRRGCARGPGRRGLGQPPITGRRASSRARQRCVAPCPCWQRLRGGICANVYPPKLVDMGADSSDGVESTPAKPKVSRRCHFPIRRTRVPAQCRRVTRSQPAVRGLLSLLFNDVVEQLEKKVFDARQRNFYFAVSQHTQLPIGLMSLRYDP